MSHQSDDCRRLSSTTHAIKQLKQLFGISATVPSVYALHFPSGRTDEDAANSENAFSQIAKWSLGLNGETTVCILTTPPDAARLIPFLEPALKFQLWIAVKLKPTFSNIEEGYLPQRHVA